MPVRRSCSCRTWASTASNSWGVRRARAPLNVGVQQFVCEGGSPGGAWGSSRSFDPCEAVQSGAAAGGEPWKFYDLGHGYCTYDFFDQCPHRMACAKCSFYRPKDSTQAQLLEGKANLLRLQQEIPLLEEERAAVEDGLAALEHLLATLVDVPTPDGGLAPRHAPRRRQPRGLRQLPVLPAR